MVALRFGGKEGRTAESACKDTSNGRSSRELDQLRVRDAHPNTISSMITRHCPARIGLLGNPSDAYNGQCLSLAIDNFSATVSSTSQTPSG